MNRLIERLAAILALGLMVGPGHAEGMSGQGGESNTFLALIDSIRHADYRGDRTELRRLAAQLSALSLPKHRAHHVEYCRKFDERRLMVRMRDGSEVVASRAASELLRGWAR